MRTLLIYFMLLLLGWASAFATDLQLYGMWRYKVDFSDNTIKLIGRIQNDDVNSSDDLLLRVYLTDEKYVGGDISGFVLCDVRYKPLMSNYGYDVDNWFSFKNIPSGLKYITIVLLEAPDYDPIVSVIAFDQVVNFPGRIQNFPIMSMPRIPVVPFSPPVAPHERQSCYSCRGTGRCPVCGGTGISRAPTYGIGTSAPCSNCNGTGVCPSCGGSGSR